MYDDELSVLDAAVGLDSPLDPLDQIPASSESDGPQYDPNEMLALLSHTDSQQRMLAARAFCEIQDARAVPQLILLLSDPCPLVRVSAAYGLGRNPSDTAIEPLINQYSRDWNGYARKGMIWALGNARDPRVVDPLVDAVKNDISAVRLWAASALAQTVNIDYGSMIKAMPPLVQVMRRDPVAAVRSNCAWSIGQICAELPSNVVYATAIDALIETFAEDDELGVREDARTAILSVGDSRGLQVIEEIEQDGLF